MKNVLITGGASGIGKAITDYFSKHEYQVYTIDIQSIEEKENVKFFKADITDEKELNNVKLALDQEHIVFDAIINVAGIHAMASFVETDFQKMKKVIDVNLCGTMLVNKTFHSLLKRDGRIVIVTSEVASFDPMPFNALYNVSKTALDTYAQGLRQELNLIGQKVITIRPGSIQTPLSDGSLVATETLADETVLYKKHASKFLGLVKKFMGKPLEPEKLAKLIYKVTLKKNPKYIYKKHQNIGLVLLNILPKKWQCGIVKLLLD